MGPKDTINAKTMYTNSEGSVKRLKMLPLLTYHNQILYNQSMVTYEAKNQLPEMGGGVQKLKILAPLTYRN